LGETEADELTTMASAKTTRHMLVGRARR
jgi:hypothetical protein